MNVSKMSRRDFLISTSTMAVAGTANALPFGAALSSTARHTPDWVRRGIVYQIALRGFTPEGTLRAAAEHLAHVAELGATIVYLSPINLQDDDPRTAYWSPRQKASGFNNPRNPYRIKDYDRLDPEYGTEDDLRYFMETAHAVGLKVLMDVVFLHCGPTSVLRERPGFIKRDETGSIVTNSYNFPLLNFDNPNLRDYLIANLTHWIKGFGVDGFRCDVAYGIPLDFWEQARTKLSPLCSDLVP
jgi:glycosidase